MDQEWGNEQQRTENKRYSFSSMLLRYVFFTFHFIRVYFVFFEFFSEELWHLGASYCISEHVLFIFFLFLSKPIKFIVLRNCYMSVWLTQTNQNCGHPFGLLKLSLITSQCGGHCSYVFIRTRAFMHIRTNTHYTSR